MSEQSAEDLARRLASLEDTVRALESSNRELGRVNRGLKLAALLALSLIGGTVLFSTLSPVDAAPPTPKVVEAEQFVLKDKENKTRAVLMTKDDGASMLVLADKDGKGRLAMFVRGDGSSAVTLDDVEGKPHAILDATPDGLCRLRIIDKEGKLQATVPAPTPEELAARKTANETAAVGALKVIAQAESVFREGAKGKDHALRYGSLQELAEAQLIDKVLGAGTKQGYLFDVRPSVTTSEFLWFGTASPQTPGQSGDHYFAENAAGVVIQSDTPVKMDTDQCKLPLPGMTAHGK